MFARFGIFTIYGSFFFKETTTFLRFICKVQKFLLYLQRRTINGKIMCTVTLSYDQNNALARRKLAALLATGLFSQESVDYKEPSQEEIEAYRQEREVFMNHSKKSMSNIIARYL
jgi:hypothetical protein